MKPELWRAKTIDGEIVEGYPFCTFTVKKSEEGDGTLARTWYMSIPDMREYNIIFKGKYETYYKNSTLPIVEDSLEKLE